MYKTAKERYTNIPTQSVKYEYYNVNTHKNVINDKINDTYTNEPEKNTNINQDPIHMKHQTTRYYTNLSDPEVWGPSFWFTLHNGASKYPISASPLVIERMKGYILGIPFMLPCIACKVHATNHIEKHKKDLDRICSGRDNLFKFFVDFHNIVNKRYNKPIVSYEEAYKIYDNGVNVSVMTYK